MYTKEDYYGQSRVCSMTPTEFEEYCLRILQGYAEEENLKDFTLTHDVKLSASDGTYQIDVYATCKAFGADMKIIGECKQYKNRVNREKVVILADKVRALKAQKGIFHCWFSKRCNSICQGTWNRSDSGIRYTRKLVFSFWWA